MVLIPRYLHGSFTSIDLRGPMPEVAAILHESPRRVPRIAIAPLPNDIAQLHGFFKEVLLIDHWKYSADGVKHRAKLEKLLQGYSKEHNIHCVQSLNSWAKTPLILSQSIDVPLCITSSSHELDESPSLRFPIPVEKVNSTLSLIRYWRIEATWFHNSSPPLSGSLISVSETEGSWNNITNWSVVSQADLLLDWFAKLNNGVSKSRKKYCTKVERKIKNCALSQDLQTIGALTDTACGDTLWDAEHSVRAGPRWATSLGPEVTWVASGRYSPMNHPRVRLLADQEVDYWRAEPSAQDSNALNSESTNLKLWKWFDNPS